MFTISKLNKLSDKIVEKFPVDDYRIGENLENPDAIIVRSANLLNMTLNDNLLAIARAGAGTNNIPINNCTEKGIVVFNTPGANANSVKELLLCSMIIASRNVIESINWTNSLKDNADLIPDMVEKGKKKFNGTELKGKRLGVIGLGATGSLVASSALDLGMDVIGYDPYLDVEKAWKLSSSIKRVTEDELITTSDFITIHVPLTPESRYMFNRDIFSKTKRGVVILNFSRADLIERTDLIEFINNNTIAKYIVDFPTYDLLGEKNIICLPHLASSTSEAEENCAIMAADEIVAYLKCGIINNSVNFPNCDIATSGKCRICCFHTNIPGMINKITAVISEKKFNVTNMTSTSNGDYAYTILDINSSNIKLEDFKNIDNIVRIRIINNANN